ncbi:MAG: hypothetical protein WBR18_16000 [Anaerolineales bacterium]
MNRRIRCLLMLGPAGTSRPEQWLGHAKLAAAVDLAQRLSELPQVEAVEALVADREQAKALAAVAGVVRLSSSDDFHFGRALTAWAQESGDGPLAYFGGAGAPLLNGAMLATVLDSAVAASDGACWVNNLHSSDWCVFWPTAGILECIQRQAVDNALGWGIAAEGGIDVKTLPVSAASRADIDTPIDPYMLENHPGVGHHLRQFLVEQADPGLRARVRAIADLLQREGSSLAVIGRSSSRVWSELEGRTHVWVRMIVEERGMVASGRLGRGEVRSMLADWVQSVGPQAAVRSLAGMVDGALWDTRVWMGAVGRWPSAKDRFAADLGWLDEIESDDLQGLTAAIREAEIPILTGGHGVVSGGILALIEGFDYLP